MRFTEDTERFNDIDYVDPNDEPVCVCADYEHATHPVFCRACMAYTDDVLIHRMEAAEESAAIAVATVPAPPVIPSVPRKPATPDYSYASIGNGLYCRVAEPKKSRNRRAW